MSKKGSNERISFGQYRLADLFLFLLIMVVCEVINVFAVRQWFQGQLFTVSVMLLVTLIVLIRWNWLGVFFPVIDGAVYCWMCGASGAQFGVYILGNAFVALVALLFLAVPKEKFTGHWYTTIGYAALGYVLLVLGRTLVGLCFGWNFVDTLLGTLGGESLNLAFAIVGLLITRRLNGMLVDQKKYLFKVTKERDAVKAAEQEYWDGYTELSDDDLKALAAMDEYDRALSFNKASLRRLKTADGSDLSDEETEIAADGGASDENGENSENGVSGDNDANGENL